MINDTKHNIQRARLVALSREIRKSCLTAFSGRVGGVSEDRSDFISSSFPLALSRWIYLAGATADPSVELPLESRRQ
jgi:hypothetical protein